MLVHINLPGPDTDDVVDIVSADGHTLTATPADADLVVTTAPAAPLAVAPGATILQFGGPLRLPTGTHVATQVLDASFCTTPAAQVLGVDLMARATLLTDPPRTAIVGAGRTDVVPLVTNAHGQHLALLFPHARDGWHWWVHENSLDTLPWIDAAVEHLVSQVARLRVGA
ncbi:hypothetical protein KZX45_03315 [Georgenia sp. EYE_87]|uniref:hypothetical protein n=1 Tax=Georgenia sp. EYE_87 TaxID=2853448 RepID=UPI002002BA75|nr:hypothetical protein [Georgenia sp. EYE_87]MCK6209572.1 hypothetical protein [Georgenia sp. EYE_87]